MTLKDAHPLILEPVTMLPNMAKGIKVANGIKIANELTLK